MYEAACYRQNNRRRRSYARQIPRDNSNAQQERLVSDAVTPKGAKETPKPELGDYLVTPDLRLAAIMMDENHGLIASSKLLGSTGASIRLSNTQKFKEGEMRWLEAQKK